MSDPVWYRSLYWRIALGFVALLAVLLSTQVIVFLWMTGRADAFLGARSPAELANTIAGDVSHALAADEALDLDGYLNGRYGRSVRPFAVVMRDGRSVRSRTIPP